LAGSHAPVLKSQLEESQNMSCPRQYSCEDMTCTQMPKSVEAKLSAKQLVRVLCTKQKISCIALLDSQRACLTILPRLQGG
jgi:hypothetical protein